MLQIFSFEIHCTERLRELAWSGVPPYMRPDVWRLVLVSFMQLYMSFHWNSHWYSPMKLVWIVVKLLSYENLMFHVYSLQPLFGILYWHTHWLTRTQSTKRIIRHLCYMVAMNESKRERERESSFCYFIFTLLHTQSIVKERINVIMVAKREKNDAKAKSLFTMVWLILTLCRSWRVVHTV